MKKLILTLGLIGCMLASALAQGTINPLNGALTRIKVDTDIDGIGDRNLTQADGVYVDLYWGLAGTTPETLAGTMTIGSTAGVLVGLPSILVLPGTEAGQIVSLQARGRSSWGWFGQSPVIHVALAPTAGPGTVIWQSTATSPNRFLPLPMVVPEPSTLAFGTLAAAFLLFRVRRSHKRTN